jgi:hypothetical protein
LGDATCIGKMINAFKIFIGRPEEKSHLGHLDVEGKKGKYVALFI